MAILLGKQISSNSGKNEIIYTLFTYKSFIYIYIYNHHHHHVVPLARISLTLSRHFSLSFISSGRSSGLHPVSSHSCCMYVRAGRPPFAWPYAGVHRSTSLMSSSLLLQQCPACLVRLTCIFFCDGRQKQRFINRKRHRHTTNDSMDSYR